MNLQLYAPLYFVLNGQLLTEEFDLKGSRESQAQRVYTTAKGLAGLSPGAPILEMNIGNAIPASGFELDMGAFIGGLAVVEFMMLGPGGKNLPGKGFCEKDDFAHAVNKAAEYNFNVVAPMVQWQ